jgi:predicted deacetylase
LCVSIHDVAPATWPDCLRLWRTVQAVADMPLTWLVVPRYHGHAQAAPPCFDAALERLLVRGHELALHGYQHLDAGPPPRTAREWFLRRVFTQGEGEFAALDAQEARRRLGLGQHWFAQRGWPLHGFVPPAWLLGEAAWAALGETPLRYTTTLRRFHCLRPAAPAPGWARAGMATAPAGLSLPALSLPALSLHYAARNAAGRCCSQLALDALLALQAGHPLVRLGLHPRDAHYPELLRHVQRLLAALLARRVPLTKAAVAETVVARWHFR